MAKPKLGLGPNDPKVGQFMIHMMGCGDDGVYETVELARVAAVAEKHGEPRCPIFILQVVEIV